MRLALPASLTLGAALLLLAAAPAQAFLDDREARRAIVELRERFTNSETQVQGQLTEIVQANAALVEQLTALRRSLLELNNQIESMRGEMARLRGGNEELARQLSELQRAQQDANQAFDARLRQFEPMRVTQDGAEVVAMPAEKRAFDAALEHIRGGDFDKAAAELMEFRRRFPDSGLLPSAHFWLGNALYGKKDYKEAITAFRAFVTGSPEHPRAPEAMLALANSQAEMRDPRAARRTLEDLLKAYPDSEAAEAGKLRMASLR
jgi:tol-pal system protein YbgF